MSIRIDSPLFRPLPIIAAIILALGSVAMAQPPGPEPDSSGAADSSVAAVAAVTAVAGSAASAGKDTVESLPADRFAGSPPSRRKPPRDRAFTLHPVFSLAISGLNVSYEAPLGQGLWSYEVPFYLGYNERVYDNPYFFAGSGFTVRRYLIERGAGTYFAPSFDFLNVHRFEKGPGPGANLFIVAPNLRMGHRWTWKAFTMDASVGFFYFDAFLTDGESDIDDLVDARALLPMTQFAIGIPF